MWHIIKSKLSKPYWQEQVVRNNDNFFIIGVAMFFIEFAMIAIYGISQFKPFPTLGVIHLFFYFVALVISAIVVTMTYCCKDNIRLLWFLHIFTIVFLLVWSSTFAVYDLKCGNGAYVLVQIFIIVAALIRLPTTWLCSMYLITYSYFVVLLLESGIEQRRIYSEGINMLIILFIACLVVALGNRFSFKQFEAKQIILAQNKKLTHYAQLDTLTGIWNRRMILRRLRNYLLTEEKVGVVLLDIDDFKSYNDVYGHLAGDDLLKRLGVFLADHAKEYSSEVGRYGGEEFLWIFSGQHLEDMPKIVEMLLAKARQCEEFKRCVTLSAGGYQADGTMGIKQILDQADQALYKAKTTGKNCFVLQVE